MNLSADDGAGFICPCCSQSLDDYDELDLPDALLVGFIEFGKVRPSFAARLCFSCASDIEKALAAEAMHAVEARALKILKAISGPDSASYSGVVLMGTKPKALLAARALRLAVYMMCDSDDLPFDSPAATGRRK